MELRRKNTTNRRKNANNRSGKKASSNPITKIKRSNEWAKNSREFYKTTLFIFDRKWNG